MSCATGAAGARWCAGRGYGWDFHRSGAVIPASTFRSGCGDDPACKRPSRSIKAHAPPRFRMKLHLGGSVSAMDPSLLPITRPECCGDVGRGCDPRPRAPSRREGRGTGVVAVAASDAGLEGVLAHVSTPTTKQRRRIAKLISGSTGCR